MHLRNLLASCFLLGCGLAGATTLDPAHPIWSRAGYDHASFRAFAEQLRAAPPRAARSGRVAEKGFGAHGMRLLVVPVYYAGQAPPALATTTLQARIFGGAPNTLKSYWQLASAGAFQLEGEVLPWLRLPQTLDRYRNVLDGNLVGNGLAGPREMVRDALRELAPHWDLHRYDADGADGIAGSGDDDGFIDLLLILHPDPGFEAEPIASGPALLAHASFLEVLDPELAEFGVQGGGYALASAQGPFGVWAHEFGHLLGLDDLYDLRVSGTLEEQPHRGGLGLWSLMAGGTWGDGGARPSALDAYSRRRLGWDDARIWQGNGSDQLPVAGRGVNVSAALLPFGDWEREYFLIERRARDDGGVVDGALPGAGILVYQVDAARTLAEDPDPPRVRLLQADGRDDLGQLANSGDAGDPFTGASELDGDSTPPLRSVRPASARVSPRLLLDAAPGEAQLLQYFASESPQLRLVQADFDAQPNRRSFLVPGEQAIWSWRLEESGPQPGAASLDTVRVDARLEFVNGFPVALQRVGGLWQPSTPLELRARSLSTQVDAPTVRLALTVDGATREFELGVPIGNFDGLSGDDFHRWRPQVLFAQGDSTRFELLTLEDMPANASSGWQLVTEGSPGYANRVESTLTSPWFSIPPAGELRLWSDAFSEAAAPGECFDGGVLELQLADGPWQLLRPQGWGVRFVRAMNSSPTADAIGFGGDEAGWRNYSAPLPASARAARARLRFGSNSLWHDGHWSVAGLGTRPAPLRAQMEFERDPLGSWFAAITLSGDAVGLNNHELLLSWRRPADPAWQDLGASQRLGAGTQSLRVGFTPPADLGVVQIGLFVRALAAPAEPLLLLALGGVQPLRLGAPPFAIVQNPAFGRASFAFASSAETRHLSFFDLRGRRVRRLALPAGLQRVDWDGADDSGTRVAAGRYFVLMEENPSPAVALTWMP